MLTAQAKKECSETVDFCFSNTGRTLLGILQMSYLSIWFVMMFKVMVLI